MNELVKFVEMALDIRTTQVLQLHIDKYLTYLHIWHPYSTTVN